MSKPIADEELKPGDKIVFVFGSEIEVDPFEEPTSWKDTIEEHVDKMRELGTGEVVKVFIRKKVGPR